MVKIARKVLEKEKISSLKEEDLSLIVRKNNGDLRGVINDLQGISQGSENTDNADLIFKLHRDTTEEIFSLIRDLFQNASTLRETRDITDKSDVDYNFLYKWVNENLPSFIQINEEIAKAYENLSLADAIFGRIQKEQDWSLLPYFYDLFSGGVVLSKKKSSATQGFRRISFPRYSASGTYSLTTTERSFIEKIRRKYEISQFEIMQELLPFLKILCNLSRKYLKNVNDWLELDAKEKKILK
jgi:DNA polymerase III delta prime subunit